jgi:uncharacterized protein (AIM24 family)
MTTQQPTSAQMERCPWCGTQVAAAQTSCPGCGGTLTFKPRRDDSGWVELPPIRDMARLRVGDSTCQIEGEIVPVADFNLADGDGVYFAHHTMLWRDTSVTVRTLPMKGALKRMFSGMPLVMTEALGPGHIAFSRDIAGEMIAIPLQRGQAVHVREHVFLAAMRQVAYDWMRSGVYYTTQNGKDQETHYPIGQFLDEFTAADQHGLLLLHAGGNAFVRELQPGEWLLVKPTAFLYKDPSVRMGMTMDNIAGVVGYRSILWLQLVGPGKIGIQSAYPPIEAENHSIVSTSSRVAGAWEGQRVASPMAAISGRRDSRARQILAYAPTGPYQFKTPPYPRSPTDYRIGLETLIAQSLVDGELPPEAMERIVRESAKHDLSAYDLRLLINHVKGLPQSR